MIANAISPLVSTCCMYLVVFLEKLFNVLNGETERPADEEAINHLLYSSRRWH